MKNCLTRILIPLTAISLTCTSVGEEDAAGLPDQKLRVAREIVDALAAENPFNKEGFRKMMMHQVDAFLERSKFGKDDAARFRSAVLEAVDEVSEEQVMDMIARPYAESFSLNELGSIRAFYQSAAGKALLGKQKQMEDSQSAQKKLFAKELFQRAQSRFEKLTQQADE